MDKENKTTSILRAVFLDRDGVINQKADEGRYITRWADFHILPGAAEGLSLLYLAGFRVIVVTNQRCVAKGLLSESELESLHQQMTALLARSGAVIDSIYYCPHEADLSCNCRKPAPGMLLAAAGAHDIDLSASWMIGDSDIDVRAGRNAGCKTVRVATSHTPSQADIFSGSSVSPDIIASSLLDAARQIIRWETAATIDDQKVEHASTSLQNSTR